MNDSGCCKFFYLREISFAVKGELPALACKKEHDINTECNKTCPDFQQIKSKLACKADTIILGNHLKFHFHKLTDLLYLLTPKSLHSKNS